MGHHNHRSQVQTELCKPQAKNPFPHVGRIELTKNYKVKMKPSVIHINLN